MYGMSTGHAAHDGVNTGAALTSEQERGIVRPVWARIDAIRAR